jgi:hypothetical protein
MSVGVVDTVMKQNVGLNITSEGKGMNLRRFELRRANNRYALGHHDLVSCLGVQVSRAHEACLGGMRVDPAYHDEVVFDAVIQHRGLVFRLARVWRAPLLGNDQVRDEKGVVDCRTTQHAAHLEPAPCVF